MNAGLLATIAVTLFAASYCASVAPAAQAAPVYDPQRAPIVFLPGLVASELSCGPGATATNLWPGQARSFLTWPIRRLFPALGRVNLVRKNGSIVGRDVSSSQCGSRRWAGGTVARHRVVPVSAQWCSPEARGPIDSAPHPCTVKDSAVAYADFGLALENQIATDARGQIFTSYAWDWRRPPRDQVDGLDRLVTQLTKRTGVKATIVAHSFGNLLMREWIRSVQRRHRVPGARVGRFLSVAGPWWGVATAWEHLAYGSLQPTLQGQILNTRVGRATLREVFSSSSGLYTLLPTRQFDGYLASQPQSEGESWLAQRPRRGVRSRWIPYRSVPGAIGSTLTTCPESSAFPCQARAMYDAAVRASPTPNFTAGGIKDFVGVVGSGVATAYQFCDRCLKWPDGGADTMAEANGGPVPHRTRKGSGDGNVPVFSATFGQNAQPTRGPLTSYFFACGVTHMGLMQNASVLARMVPYLTGDAALDFDDVLASTPCEVSGT